MKTLHTFLTLAAIFLLPVSISLAKDAKAPKSNEPAGTIVVELVNKGFNTFVAAASKTDLLDKLGTGTYTVLAPNDNAFREIPKAQLDALLADKEKLTVVLSNHIIEGKLTTADLKSSKPKTLAGNVLDVTVVDGKVKVGAATIVVVRANIPATNGVVHGIDKVLMP